MPIPVTIADDSAMSRKMIKKALPENWDIELYEATNGREALEAVQQGKADILFLDLQMPVMTGYEVLENLHSHQDKTIVIVISADIQPEAVAQVNALGAFRFLKKPLQSEHLKQTLHELGLL